MVLYNLDESLDFGCTGNGYGDNDSFKHWSQIAEASLPLTTSKLASANRGQFQASIETRSKQISTKVIVVNLVSLLINLLLAVIAFYFSITKDSTATTAFAADCLLDLISSAILLWRYHGDLNSVYMHAREQIACIYLGALFELSAIGIIIKSISDFTTTSNSPPSPQIQLEATEGSYELVYLAIAATIACIILTIFKCALFKILRDNSILLDVINTVISTVFAMSIVMSQVLINVNPSFWYLDPVLSIVLAIFMMGFGIKVIHQNFNILKPIYCSNQQSAGGRSNNLENQSSALILMDRNKKINNRSIIGSCERLMNNNYGSNLPDAMSSLNGQQPSQTRPSSNWRAKDYSSITFH